MRGLPAGIHLPGQEYDHGDRVPRGLRVPKSGPDEPSGLQSRDVECPDRAKRDGGVCGVPGRVLLPDGGHARPGALQPGHVPPTRATQRPCSALLGGEGDRVSERVLVPNTLFLTSFHTSREAQQLFQFFVWVLPVLAPWHSLLHFFPPDLHEPPEPGQGGRYNPLTGERSCSDCPKGFFCPALGLPSSGNQPQKKRDRRLAMVRKCCVPKDSCTRPSRGQRI